MAAVFMPELKKRECFQVDDILPRSENWSSSHRFCADLRSGREDVAKLPKLSRTWGQQFLRHFYCPLYESLRSCSECQVNPFRCTKQIGDNGKLRAFHVSKKESLSLLVD